MKKSIAAFLCTLLLFFALPTPLVFADENDPLGEVAATTYMVIDQATGQVLLQANADARMYPASITKMMTMALAMEACGGNMGAKMTVSNEAVATIGSGGSAAGFRPGEEITVQDAMYAALLVSGNDAANVLAEYVSGSISTFIDVMNAKAAELGCTGTHFVNPHGYFDENHYTTAHDIALITQFALSVPGFREFFSATSYTQPPTNKNSEGRVFNTSNVMAISGNSMYYDGIIGGKSGWTQESRYTNVCAASRNGAELICVVMNSSGKYQKYTDSRILLDYCYNNWTPCNWTPANIAGVSREVTDAEGKVLSTVTFLPTDVTFMLPNGYALEDITYSASIPDACVFENGVSGTFSLSLHDTPLVTMPLQVDGLAELIEMVAPATAVSAENGTAAGLWKRILTVALWVLGIAAAGAVAVFGCMVLYCLHLKQQQKRRREARRAEQRARERDLRRQALIHTQQLPAMRTVNGLHVQIGGRQNGRQRVAVDKTRHRA